jgi:putative FmdB family regulatory protein
MPLYDFRCTACGHEFEDMIASSAAAPACPECKAASEKVPRVPLYKKGKPVNPQLAKARWEYKNATREGKKKLRGGLD